MSLLRSAAHGFGAGLVYRCSVLSGWCCARVVYVIVLCDCFNERR